MYSAYNNAAESLVSKTLNALNHITADILDNLNMDTFGPWACLVGKARTHTKPNSRYIRRNDKR
jgi:hypothetical protein